MKQAAATDDTVCKFCYSTELWSAFFDTDELATDGTDGSPWRTVCQRCGEFQDKKRPSGR